MKIRSITYFCNPHYPLDEAAIRIAGEFLSQARAAYEAGGYEVQSTRLATVAFPLLLGDKEVTLPGGLPELAVKLEQLLQDAGIAYASLGPALPEEPHRYEAIPDALAATQNVFFGGVMADNVRGLDLAAVRACARVIVDAAPLDPNGFANLRFAALANVPPGAPFFPAAYHDGLAPAFAIATEAADLAIRAFTEAASVEEGRRLLVSKIEKHGAALSRIVGRDLPDVRFLGVDFSLAPLPDRSAVARHGLRAAGRARYRAARLAGGRGHHRRVGRARSVHACRLQRADDARPGGCDARPARRGRHPDREGCAAVLGGLRHRPGHHPASGRHDRRAARPPAAGPLGAGAPPR